MAFARFLRGHRSLGSLLLILVGMFFSLVLWGASMKRQAQFDLRTPKQFSLDLPGCTAIVSGDIQGKVRELEAILGSRKADTSLTEDFYLKLTKNCEDYIEERGFITAPLSEEERDFPIAYSMVIHDKIEMFERLLRAIYTPQNIYCIHVDQKSSEEFQKAVEVIVSCFPNVFIASKLERVVYASWFRVQADLNCMEDLLNSKVQWSYMLNTCGTDFPIKTNREMVQALKALRGKNSMESEPASDAKAGRWIYHHNVTDTVERTTVTKSPPPISSPMFSGNAYFVVTRAFVEHVMQDGEVQRLMEWEKDTNSPDESLWATLQRMPSVPGSVPTNKKYDVSDMLALPRVVKWGYLAGDMRKGAPYYPCSGVYRRSVCVYGVGDLQWLLNQQQLFANKFDPAVDDLVIRCLESVLRFRALDYD